MIKGRLDSDLNIIVNGSCKEYLIDLVGNDIEFEKPVILFSKRSLNQNRYLHGVVIPIILAWELERGSDWCAGKTKEQLFLLIKQHIYANILGQNIVEAVIDGRYYFTFDNKPMSKMSTLEFCKSVELIQLYYSRKGLYIPDPVNI